MLLKFFPDIFILSVYCPGEAANDKPFSLAGNIDVCPAHTAQLSTVSLPALPDEATALTRASKVT